MDGGARGKCRWGAASEIGLVFAGNSAGDPCGGEDLTSRAVSRAGNYRVGRTLGGEKICRGIPRGKQPT